MITTVMVINAIYVVLSCLATRSQEFTKNDRKKLLMSIAIYVLFFMLKPSQIFNTFFNRLFYHAL